jgi:hypothetical protein
MAGAFELRQHPGRVGQAEGLERAVGQHAAPAVENHHGLRAGVDLRVQVHRHGIGIDLPACGASGPGGCTAWS